MDEFEEQIRLQALASTGQIQTEEETLTRTDEDGTVMEFDREKKAWFPKIDADFIAQYQMNYGTDTAASSTSSIPPQPEDVNSKEYYDWYQKYYGNYDAYQQYDQNYSTAQPTQMSEEEKKKTEEDKKKYDEYWAKQSADADTSKMTEEEKEKYEEEKTKYEEYCRNYNAWKNALNMPSEDRKKYDEYHKYCAQDTSRMNEEEKKQFEENKTKYNDYWNKYMESPRTAGMTDKEKAEYEKHWKEHHEAPETTKLAEEEKRKHEEYKRHFHEFFHYGEDYEESDEEDYKTKKGKQLSEQEKEAEKKEKAKKRAEERKKKPEWFEVDEAKNTNVYVTGLPHDITEEEYDEMMKKFGLIMFDPFTKKPKLKLYKDASGAFKGDGLCCYIKNESVELCLDLMNESTLRGSKIYVERAKFERKGEFNPDKAKRKKMSNKQKKKIKERQAKLFEWRGDEEVEGRQRYERIIVVKNVFDPKTFETNPTAINDVRENLRSECSNLGEVKKVIVYDRHQEGVATVAFPDPEVADRVIAGIHKRMFYGRVITAFTWDGKTKYDVQETEEEAAKRRAEWLQFLDDEEEKEKQAQRDKDKAQNKSMDREEEVDNTSMDKEEEVDKTSMDKELKVEKTSDEITIEKAENKSCDIDKVETKAMDMEEEVEKSSNEKEDKKLNVIRDLPMDDIVNEGEEEKDEQSTRKRAKKEKSEDEKDCSPLKRQKMDEDI